jgi:hypothetical protein
MARTFEEAVAAIRAKDEVGFDSAVGLTTKVRAVAPVAPEVAAAFAPLDPGFYARLARGVARRYSYDPVRTEDAQGEVLLELMAKRPGLFREDPRSWVSLLVVMTRFRLKSPLVRGAALSIDALRGATGDAALAGATRCVAEVDDGGDERREPPPRRGEPWTYGQIIGALQRFRDYHGRPPKSYECRASNGLPSHSAIRRHFARFADAIYAAGMVPEYVPLRTRPWEPREAAEVCYSYRRRNSIWPSWADAKRHPGELPGTGAMLRFFGGTRSCDVQRGTELILRVAG